MDLKNRHPLNAIDGYENLSMLEALIPFVDYQLKLPLALFIKFNEVRLIIKCFQSPHNLSRLGLHCATNDPFDMIGSLTGMSPDLIKTMMSMMDVGDNSMFSDLFNNFTNNNSTNFTNEYHSSTAPTGQHPHNLLTTLKTTFKDYLRNTICSKQIHYAQKQTHTTTTMNKLYYFLFDL